MKGKAIAKPIIGKGRALLALLIIASLLAACGAKSESKEGSSAQPSESGNKESAAKTVVNYWYWLDDASNNTMEELIQKFNQSHPDIQVVGRMIPFSDYQQTLINSYSTNALPDAARFKDWWIGQFTENKLLEPLDEYTKNWEYRGDIDDVFWNTGRTADPNSPVYMMPHQYITFYLYYRKDLFEQANLQPPKTFDEFLNAAKKLTDPSKQRYGFAYRGGSGGQDQWYAFMLAGGARMVDDQGNIVINNEKAVEVNNWYLDLFRKYKVAPPTAISDSYAQLMAGFQAGTTAMMAHHIGSYETLHKALGDKLGVVPMPQADPAHPATMGTMTGNVMFSSSKNKEATWTFLSWLSGPEATDILSKSTNGQLPVLKSLTSKPEYQSRNEGWKVALESEKFAHVWPPLKGVGTIAGHTWKDNSDLALFNKIDSKQMLDEIAKALQEK
jgi:multiple sugar transport system substrate-binding protein